MSRKIVRSAVQHSVSFNPSTRNALSPQYNLDEGEKKEHIKDHILCVNEDPIKKNKNKIKNPKSIADNRQKFTDDTPITTQQFFGAKDVLEENTAYIDKTHIVDHFARFSQTVNPRSSTQFVSVSTVTQNPSIPPKHRKTATKIGKQVKVDSHIKYSGELVEDEFQAKILRMKKKLQNANQKLKDIQERDQ